MRWTRGALGAGLVWLALACGGLDVLPEDDAGGPETDAPEPAPADVVPEPEPDDTDAAEPAPEPPEPAEPEPEPEPSPKPRPAAPDPKPAAPDPKPAAPEPKPAPAPAPEPAGAKGRVTVEGQATVALLRANGARFAVPGEVPVGVYTIEAVFGSRPPVRAGKVNVPEGGVTIRCNVDMGICRPK